VSYSKLFLESDLIHIRVTTNNFSLCITIVAWQIWHFFVLAEYLIIFQKNGKIKRKLLKYFYKGII
jgi:hypothetical protein